MITLTEIEQAVSQLPRPQQEELFRTLESRLRRPIPTSSETREEWMARLAVLRQQTQGGLPSGPSSQSILDELREDR